MGPHSLSLSLYYFLSYSYVYFVIRTVLSNHLVYSISLIKTRLTFVKKIKLTYNRVVTYHYRWREREKESYVAYVPRCKYMRFGKFENELICSKFAVKHSALGEEKSIMSFWIDGSVPLKLCYPFQPQLECVFKIIDEDKSAYIYYCCVAQMSPNYTSNIL